MCRTDSLLGNVYPILALQWPRNYWKWVKMLVSDHYLQKHSNLCSTLIVWVFRTDSLSATLTQFWPSCGHKWLKMADNGGFRPLSEKVFTQPNSIHNPIQTWSVHLLGQCSELIRFWATLGKLWSLSGQIITENFGLRSLSKKVFTQSNSNLACTLIEWVCRI